MHRLTTALLLGGAVLLTSYVNAPAAVTPSPVWVPPTALSDFDAVALLADDAAEQTERLRARMATGPSKPVSRRDPFSFGSHPEPASAEEPLVGPPDVQTEMTTPEIVWPTMVALLTDHGDPAVRTAVLALGDAVEVLKVGDAVGGFRIREIGDTAVELVHVETSTVARLAIR